VNSTQGSIGAITLRRDDSEGTNSVAPRKPSSNTTCSAANLSRSERATMGCSCVLWGLAWALSCPLFFGRFRYSTALLSIPSLFGDFRTGPKRGPSASSLGARLTRYLSRYCAVGMQTANRGSIGTGSIQNPPTGKPNWLSSIDGQDGNMLEPSLNDGISTSIPVMVLAN